MKIVLLMPLLGDRGRSVKEKGDGHIRCRGSGLMDTRAIDSLDATGFAEDLRRGQCFLFPFSPAAVLFPHSP